MSAHGKRSSYVQGCRCEPCTQANRDYQRAYMAAHRVAATDGRRGGFRTNYGMRCDNGVRTGALASPDYDPAAWDVPF